MTIMNVMGDAIDRAGEQWSAEMPDLDVSPAEVLARIERLAHLIEIRQNHRLRRRPGKLVANRGDFDVLRALRRAGPPYRMAPREIAEQMLVSAAGLSGRLKRLADEGWVTRVPSSDDARSLLVQLTPDGLADLDEDLQAHYAFEDTLLAAFDKDERMKLSELLRAFLARLETGVIDATGHHE